MVLVVKGKAVARMHVSDVIVRDATIDRDPRRLKITFYFYKALVCTEAGNKLSFVKLALLFTP